jgi:hypothetical protein
MTSRRALTALVLALLVSVTSACTDDSDTPAGREGDRGGQTAEPS